MTQHFIFPLLLLFYTEKISEPNNVLDFLRPYSYKKSLFIDNMLGCADHVLFYTLQMNIASLKHNLHTVISEYIALLNLRLALYTGEINKTQFNYSYKKILVHQEYHLRNRQHIMYILLSTQWS